MAEVLEKTLYETDYYAWTRQQAAELRALADARSNLPLDLENLAEEVESLGGSDLATVKSQIRRIIEHLLKLEYSPALDPRAGWTESIDEARLVIEDVITSSLRRDAASALQRAYEQGRKRAVRALSNHGEHDAADALPNGSPYTFEQIITEDWYAPNRHGHADPAL